MLLRCLWFMGMWGTLAGPSGKDFDAGVPLSLEEIALDSHSLPSLMQVKIECSKTDSFRQGVGVGSVI